MQSLLRRFRHTAGLTALLLVVAAVPPVVVLGTATPARASFGISQRWGVDACGINTTARASAFWNNTPYSNIGVYIGGISASCPMNSASFMSALVAQGWQIMPLWVGPQASCSSFAHRMSSNATTAFEQGKTEAHSSYLRLQSLGMSVDNTPVIYDLENYDTTNTTCLNAAKAFIRGWVTQAHVPTAQKSGVYGSACASGLSTFASLSPAPDFITGADWDNVKSVRSMSCISSSSWTGSRRHKQYRGDHSETWNGVTISVDSDCSNAPTYPGPNELDTGQGCI
jgi:hypothetical protein